jgi:hypothetical protein
LGPLLTLLVKTPADLLGSFFGVVPPPLGHSLPVCLSSGGTTKFSVHRVVVLLFGRGDDGTIVIEAEGRPNVNENLRCLYLEKSVPRLCLNVTKNDHLGLLPADLSEVCIERGSLSMCLF